MVVPRAPALAVSLPSSRGGSPVRGRRDLPASPSADVEATRAVVRRLLHDPAAAAQPAEATPLAVARLLAFDFGWSTHGGAVFDPSVKL